MFFQTIALAHQAFQTVAIHRVVKPFLGNRHGKLHGNAARLLRQIIVTFYRIRIYGLIRIHNLLDGEGGFKMFAAGEDLFIFYGLHILSGMRPAHQ